MFTVPINNVTQKSKQNKQKQPMELYHNAKGSGLATITNCYGVNKSICNDFLD